LAVFLPLVALSGHRTLPAFILAWAGAGALAGLLVPVYYRHPFVKTGTRWLSYTWWFAWRYLASYLTTQTAGLSALVGVGAIAGNTQLGGLQGSIVLTRPYGLVQAAMNASAVSEVARSSAGSAEVRAHAFRTSRMATLVALANAGVMLALPAFLGRVVLGQSWEAARPLLLATGVQIVFLGMTTGLRATLMGRKQTQFTVALDVAATILTMTAVFLGAWLNGAVGAVWGATIVQGLAVLLWWRLLAWRSAVGALEPTPVEPETA
jgi:O-antigen/teichoic acid export membrane protein